MPIPESTRQYALPVILFSVALWTMASRPSLHEQPGYTQAVQVAHQLTTTGRQVAVVLCSPATGGACIEVQENFQRETFAIGRRQPDQVVLHNTVLFKDECMIVQWSSEAVFVENQPCSAIFQ